MLLQFIYSQSLNQFVKAIITNIRKILLANLVEMVSKNEMDAVRMQLSKAINFMLCSLLAITVLTVVCAKDIVTIVFLGEVFLKKLLKLHRFR